MSMIGGYRRISPDALRRLVENPDLARAALDFGLSDVPGVPGMAQDASLADFVAGYSEEQREEIQARLAEFFQSRGMEGSRDTGLEDSLRGMGVSEDDFGQPITIDKAWHGLHFLLTGSAEETKGPLGSVVLGGHPLGEDLGYGPPRYLRPEEVSEAARALEELGLEALEARYSPLEMSRIDIYGGNWDDPKEQAWLRQAAERVLAEFQAASRLGWAMLLYLT